MLLLWVGLLGVPLVRTLRDRRQQVTPGTTPYVDELRRERAAHQVHAERWVGGGRA
jgi:hypothetical protein